MIFSCIIDNQLRRELAAVLPDFFKRTSSFIGSCLVAALVALPLITSFNVHFCSFLNFWLHASRYIPSYTRTHLA